MPQLGSGSEIAGYHNEWKAEKRWKITLMIKIGMIKQFVVRLFFFV